MMDVDAHINTRQHRHATPDNRGTFTKFTIGAKLKDQHSKKHTLATDEYHPSNDARRWSKSPWTTKEDEELRSLVRKMGDRNWATIARYLPNRSGKQCRERWHNHLRDDLLQQPWSPQEDDVLQQKQVEYGNRWSAISGFLPGRSENSIKNRWYSHIKPALENAAKKRNSFDSSYSYSASSSSSSTPSSPKKMRRENNVPLTVLFEKEIHDEQKYQDLVPLINSSEVAANSNSDTIIAALNLLVLAYPQNGSAEDSATHA